MLNHILRRIAAAIPVLIFISMGIFLLVHLTPGDPVAMQTDPELASVDPAYIERRRAELGLDQPLPVQYVKWAGEVAQGNIGYSFVSRRPVLEMVQERMSATFQLMGSALLVALALSIPLGVIAALFKNTWIDYLTATFSLSAISVPSFFLGLSAIYILGVKLMWLPTSGMGEDGIVDDVKHLIMPAGILGIALAGPLMRYVRSGLLDELGKDYVRVAKAKGASPWRVVIRHALRNSLVPLITVIAIQIPQMLAGAVVLEQIFAWPGMGRLVISSISQRDYPVIIGFTMFVSILVVGFNLLADVLYAAVDPRIKLK